MSWRKIEHHAIQTAREAVASGARVASAELTVLEIRAAALRNALQVRNEIDPDQRSTKADQWEQLSRIIYDRSAADATYRNRHRFGEATHTLTTNLIWVFETPNAKPDNVVKASMRAAEVIPRMNEAFLAGANAARAWMLEGAQLGGHFDPAIGVLPRATRGPTDR